MNETTTTGSQIARKRRMLLLSQRKAASLVTKLYGVKLSHSYLSLIERDLIRTLGPDLKNALEDFFSLTPVEAGHHYKPGGEAESPGRVMESAPVHRIPLHEKGKAGGCLDIAGPLLADFAVALTSDMPEMGFFCGDILICRKGNASKGDLLVIERPTGFTCSYDHRDLSAAAGTVVMVFKKSVSQSQSQAARAAAAAVMEEEFLIEELAGKTGISKIDLRRSVEILKTYKPEDRS